MTPASTGTLEILLALGLDPNIGLPSEEEDVVDDGMEARFEVMAMGEEETIDRLLAAAATAAEGTGPFPLLAPGLVSVKSESSVSDSPTDQSTSNTAER